MACARMMAYCPLCPAGVLQLLVWDELVPNRLILHSYRPKRRPATGVPVKASCDRQAHTEVRGDDGVTC